MYVKAPAAAKKDETNLRMSDARLCPKLLSAKMWWM